jgi:LacI family transcriptional regulator
MAKSSTRVRLSDVAKASFVSVATASKALNETGRMSAETRARIKQTAKDLGFRPNAMAQALINQRSLTVGLLTNDSYGRFTMPLLAGVSEELVEHRMSVFMCNIENDPALGQLHLDAMIEKQVDGIIVTGKRIDRELPVDLSNAPIPVVYAFCQAPENSIQLVSDDFQGASDAADWLVRLGRTNIVHITGPESFASARERANAFNHVIGEDATVLHGDWSEAWGHEAIARLWSADTPNPDGIFCGNDQIARGVIDALRERGASVPQDVSVIGFDNWEIMCAATRPPMTTVDMSMRGIGREAVRLIMELNAGKPVQPGLRRVPCQLIVRGSCGGSTVVASE